VRLSTLTLFFAVLFLIVVVLARFLPLPFAVFTVATSSMEPSIRVLDIAITFGKSYGIGDVVVWCSTAWYCVMHRVVNITGEFVVTKGDANPVPDPPIPRELVRGKVVLVIPRELWLPPLALLIGFIIYSYRRALMSVLTPALIPLAMYVTVMAIAIALVAPQTGFSLEVPELHLSRTYVEDGGVVCIAVVEYLAKGIEVEQTTDLRVFDRTVPPLHISGASIAFVVPEDIAMRVATKGLKLNVSVEAVLTRKGVLRGSYQITLSPPKPVVRVFNGSLIIENTSCYSLLFNITWVYAELGEPWKHINTSVIVKGGAVQLEPPVNASYIYADVRYLWMGSEFLDRLRVR